MNKMTLLILSIAAIVLAGGGRSLGTSTGTILADVGALAVVVAWIGGMIKMVQLKRWGWFVAVLLLTPLTTLLYGIYGPTSPRA